MTERDETSTRRRAAAAGALLLLALAGPVAAQTAPAAAAAAAPSPEAQRLYLRSLAATCAHCHGTDGRAVQGEALVALAGRPREDLLTQLMAFRTGDRKATIMHQITRGYSEVQLEMLAAYFAAQK
ncbi:MAG: cytochrome C [Proteobacteria bacterium]|nr:cytochrome C [Pseudomonadota bacterium]